MPRKAKFDIEKHVSYNASSNKSTCLVPSCNKELSGKLRSNIRRHYKLVHKLDIESVDECDGEDVPVWDNSKKSNLGTTIDKHLLDIKSEYESDSAQEFLEIKSKHESSIEDEGDIEDILVCKKSKKSNNLRTTIIQNCVGLLTKKQFNVENFVSYDASSNKSTCLVLTCKQEFCGKHNDNIKRHYKLMHNQDIQSDDESNSEDDPVCTTSKKSKNLDTNIDKIYTLDIGSEDESDSEDVPVCKKYKKSKLAKKRFNLEKFVSYDASSKKSTCLVPTCNRELCGKLRSNIRRHYKLVHKLDIECDGEDVPVWNNSKKSINLDTKIDKNLLDIKSEDESDSTQEFLDIESKNKSGSDDEGDSEDDGGSENVLVSIKSKKPNNSSTTNDQNSEELLTKKQFNVDNFVSYDASSNKSTCLVPTCKKELCGKFKANIKRHYKLVHKLDIECDGEDVPVWNNSKQSINFDTKIDKNHSFDIKSDDETDTEDVPVCKKFKKSKLSTTIDESYIELVKKKRFNIEKFVSYDATSNKSTCLVPNCKKELCGKFKANIKRHYKLVHKQDIQSDTEDVPVCKKIKKSKLMTKLDKHDFLKCCVGLVTKKDIPLSIFDDQECFKQLISPYEQKFNINLNSSNIETLLEKASSHIKSKIAALVKHKLIWLKIDIARRMERIIVGIDIQYINKYKICVNTIALIQTTKQQTTTYLKEEILKCLKEYNIHMHQIYSNTTDIGANVLELSALLQEMQSENIETDFVDKDIVGSNHIESHNSYVLSIGRCAAHNVQLAANDVIKTLESDIEKCRQIAKRLQISVRSGYEEIGLPCLDVIKRWNSTYNMINKILSLKEYIENFESANNFDINWIFIQNFVNAFTPLAKCNSKLQKEYILGDFFRDWLTCELELEELVPLNIYAGALLDAMRTRKDILFNHDAFASAIYLDPRFNFRGTPFLSDACKQNAMDHLLKIYDVMQKNGKKTNAEDDTTTSTANPFDKLDLHVQNLITTHNYTASIKQKLNKVSDGERAHFGTNVLDYWRISCGTDKDMTQLVETVLAVPATQVSVERSFSELSTILTKLRSNLSEKSLSNLITTKLNYELLDFSNCNVDNVIENDIVSE